MFLLRLIQPIFTFAEFPRTILLKRLLLDFCYLGNLAYKCPPSSSLLLCLCSTCSFILQQIAAPRVSNSYTRDERMPWCPSTPSQVTFSFGSGLLYKNRKWEQPLNVLVLCFLGRTPVGSWVTQLLCSCFFLKFSLSLTLPPHIFSMYIFSTLCMLNLRSFMWAKWPQSQGNALLGLYLRHFDHVYTCFYVCLNLICISIMHIKGDWGARLHMHMLMCMSACVRTNLGLKLVQSQWTHGTLMCISVSTHSLMQLS